MAKKKIITGIISLSADRKYMNATDYANWIRHLRDTADTYEKRHMDFIRQGKVTWTMEKRV